MRQGRKTKGLQLIIFLGDFDVYSIQRSINRPQGKVQGKLRLCTKEKEIQKMYFTIETAVTSVRHQSVMDKK